MMPDHLDMNLNRLIVSHTNQTSESLVTCAFVEEGSL